MDTKLTIGYESKPTRVQQGLLGIQVINSDTSAQIDSLNNLEFFCFKSKSQSQITLIRTSSSFFVTFVTLPFLGPSY
jgi:hypothetical protein